MDNTLSCSTEYKLLEKERKWITAELNKYGVSYTRGFVPDQNPLVTLKLFFKISLNLLSYSDH